MKKALLLICSLTLFFASCSNDSDSGTSDPNAIDQSKIYGWWYRNANTQTVSYKAYYFGEDGVYKQDQSNFGLGMGVGTWEWTNANTIQMTPNSGGGIAGGAVSGTVFKVSNDSLVFASEELRLSKVEPN
jgi:hypothetical protein